MSWLIASTVLLFIFGEILFAYGVLKDNKKAMYTGLAVSFYFIVMAAFWKPFPKAIDVYRGITDIEYIYKNGRVVDSVVVFKNIEYVR